MERKFFPAQISNRISGVGNVISMKPERTTAHGSVLRMKVVGDGGSRVMTGADLRRVLNLRSTRFTVIPQYGGRWERQEQRPSSYRFSSCWQRFRSRCRNESVGGCNLARQGYGYQQILLHYYRGTTLARIAVQ